MNEQIAQLVRERAAIDARLASFTRGQQPEPRQNMHFACGYAFGKFAEWIALWEEWEAMDSIYSDAFIAAWQQCEQCEQCQQEAKP